MRLRPLQSDQGDEEVRTRFLIHTAGWKTRDRGYTGCEWIQGTAWWLAEVQSVGQELGCHSLSSSGQLSFSPLTELPLPTQSVALDSHADPRILLTEPAQEVQPAPDFSSLCPTPHPHSPTHTKTAEWAIWGIAPGKCVPSGSPCPVLEFT